MRPEIYQNDEALPAGRRGGGWLIGNFDGLHRGHRALIDHVRAEFPEPGLITFEPHPYQFFHPGKPFLRLTPWPERASLLGQAGIRRLVVRRFDAQFAALSARQFIDEVIRGQCGADLVAVGGNFRFGAGRQGDVTLLADTLGSDRVRILAPVLDEQGLPFSSSRIRAALTTGNTALAERLLGWPAAVKAGIQAG